MKLSSLTALSPIDGRYSEKVAKLRPIFSEYGLNYYRSFIEVRWLEHLSSQSTISEVTTLSAAAEQALNNLITNYNEIDAERIKQLESQTNHDVKAVEYFIKEKLAHHPELSKLTEFVHFACTSEDINNLSYALMLKAARETCLLPSMELLISAIHRLAQHYADLPMLSRTHGQPASPTTVGKEMANTLARLVKQRQTFIDVK